MFNIRRDPVRSIMNFCQHLFKDPECWVIWTRH
ncbi:hypothetical protein AbauAttikon1_0005 [Acinetobacter phage Abau_Attikon1]